jgi:hypothetical protein
MIVSFCRIFLSFAVNDRWGNDTTGVHGSFFVSFSLCLYVLYVVARALFPLSLYLYFAYAHTNFPLLLRHKTAEYSSAYWLTHPWEENSGMFLPGTGYLHSFLTGFAAGIDVFSYGLNRQSTVYNYSTSAQLIRLLVRTVRISLSILLCPPQNGCLYLEFCVLLSLSYAHILSPFCNR